MLVERKLGSDPEVYPFTRNSKVYQNYSHALYLASIGTGLQFKTTKLLPNRNFNSLSQLNIYKSADIIHLHNLHGNYFDLELLPKISQEKTVVWTLQDMWAFTGHCAHALSSNNWHTNQCRNCGHNDRHPPIMIDTGHYFWKLKQQIYRKSQLNLVAPSNWLAGLIRKSMLKTHPMTVIHNGADTTVFKSIPKSRARARLGWPEDKFIVLFAANFGTSNPWKGGQYIKTVVEENLLDDSLLVTLGNQISSKSKHLWNLPFIKDRKKMAEYYQAADLLIYPTIADTCPLTVLESMACGTPVVSFATGGVVEMIDHRKDGYLAKYKDITDLIRGINYFKGEPKRLKVATKEASYKIEQKFNLKIMLKKYSSLYEDLLR